MTLLEHTIKIFLPGESLCQLYHPFSLAKNFASANFFKDCIEDVVTSTVLGKKSFYNTMVAGPG